MALNAEAPLTAAHSAVGAAGDRPTEVQPAAAPETTGKSVAETGSPSVAEPVVAITTGSITGSPSAVAPPATADAAPVPVAIALASAAPDSATLPPRARFIEMTCGLDHRRDGRTFARAFEISRGSGAPDIGTIVAFEVVCEKSTAGQPVPRALMTADQADVVRSSLQRTSEGGWSYWHPRSRRLVRLRLEGDHLIIAPSSAEVAVLRRKLAENPAQLETMPPDIRRNFELAVSGEGFPEYRRLRDADQLDGVFDAAVRAATPSTQIVGEAQEGMPAGMPARR